MINARDRLEEFLNENLGDDSHTQAIRLVFLGDIELLHYVIALGLRTAKQGDKRSGHD
jgi:hypothetical protein